MLSLLSTISSLVLLLLVVVSLHSAIFIDVRVELKVVRHC